VINTVTATIQPTVTPQSTIDNAVEYEKPTVQMPVGEVSTSVHIPLTTPDSIQDGTMIQPTKTLKSEDNNVSSAQSSVVTMSDFSHRNMRTVTASDSKQEHVTSTATQSTVILSSSMSVSMMGPDVAQGSLSKDRVTTRTVINPSSVVVESVPPKEEEKAPPVHDSKKVDSPVEVAQQNENSNGNIGQKEPTDAAQNDGKEASNGNGDQFVQDLPVTAAASAGKRESAIMRLNNRVKALELNMSLSSR
jgi:hypothetical protein